MYYLKYSSSQSLENNPNQLTKKQIDNLSNVDIITLRMLYESTSDRDEKDLLYYEIQKRDQNQLHILLKKQNKEPQYINMLNSIKIQLSNFIIMLKIFKLDENKNQLEENKAQLEKNKAQLEENKNQLEENKIKLEKDKAQLEKDKIKLEVNKAQLEKDKIKLEVNKIKLEKDKAQLEENKVQLEENKAQLEKNKAQLDKLTIVSKELKQLYNDLNKYNDYLSGKIANNTIDGDNLIKKLKTYNVTNTTKISYVIPVIIQDVSTKQQQNESKLNDMKTLQQLKEEKENLIIRNNSLESNQRKLNREEENLNQKEKTLKTDQENLNQEKKTLEADQENLNQEEKTLEIHQKKFNQDELNLEQLKGNLLDKKNLIINLIDEYCKGIEINYKKEINVNGNINNIIINLNNIRSELSKKTLDLDKIEDLSKNLESKKDLKTICDNNLHINNKNSMKHNIFTEYWGFILFIIILSLVVFIESSTKKPTDNYFMNNNGINHDTKYNPMAYNHIHNHSISNKYLICFMVLIISLSIYYFKYHHRSRKILSKNNFIKLTISISFIITTTLLFRYNTITIKLIINHLYIM